MGVFDFFKRKPQKSRMGRNYYGANQGRLFADFVAPANSADSTLRLALPVLRDRSRDLARNNEYAKRYLNLIKKYQKHIVGLPVMIPQWSLGWH